MNSTKSNGLDACDIQPAEFNTIQKTCNPILSADPDPSKKISNLRALFAMCGFSFEVASLHDSEPTFWVSRWDCSRPFESIHDVQCFLRQIGGAV